MALDDATIEAINDALVSHAMTLGVFEAVNGHEPENKPGLGNTCSMWLQRLAPARSSGLSSTTALWVHNARIFRRLNDLDPDRIEPEMLKAISALYATYNADFDLGGLVRCVDIFGMAGVPLDGSAGYLDQDEEKFRVFTMTVPLLINDAWEQS